MKKKLAGILCLILTFSLMACGEEEKPKVTTQPETAATTEATEAAPAEIYYNTKWDGKSLRVLCVGNSFARNATADLYKIAKAHGIEDITLGVLHIGGCTVERHWNNAQNDAAAYKYLKNTTGSWETTENVTLLQGLQDEPWDVITITQGSGYYGIPSAYEGCLEGLVGFLEENKTNPEAQLAFHMTWALPKSSTNERFEFYGNDQDVMYQCIVDTAKNTVMVLPEMDFVLPSGTAIQNARTALGDMFVAEDGFHLNEKGQYVAAYVWFAYLTGQPIDKLEYLSPAVAPMKSTHQPILDAINGAVAQPYGVTPVLQADK